MKKPLLYIGSVLIFILAAVAFVFVPAKAGNSVSKDSIVFGKYDKKPIEYKPGTEFARAVKNITDNYQRQGINIDDTQYFYIYSYAFNNAIQEIATKKAVDDSGYKPSTQEINRQMLKSAYFLDENGKYSPRLYNLYSNEQIEEIRNNVERFLILTRYQEDMFGSDAEAEGNKYFGIKSNDEEIEFLSKIGAKKRQFDMISFNKDDYPESEVLAFAKSNQNLFDKYDLSAISFDDEATAKKVSKQIANNEIKFEDAVGEEYSKKYYTDNSGKITASYQYQIKGYLADESSLETVKALAKDSYSDVIKTSNGYTIFRKDGDFTVANFEDSNTLDVVKKYIKSNESGKIEDYFITEAKNFTAKAIIEGFDETSIVDLYGAEKFNLPAFSLNFGANSIADKLPTDIAKPLASATTNENFWEKAFSLKVGEYSEPIVLGNYVIVLKYNNEENASDINSDLIKSEIVMYDQASAKQTLLDSDKIENNIFEAYTRLHSNKN